MDPITRIYGRPRSVRVLDADLLVGEARLCDLADLQDWLDARSPDPLDAIEGRLADPETTGAERRALLLSALEAAENPPAVRGEASGDAAFATPGGRAFELWVAAKRFQPLVTGEWCAEAVVRDPAGCDRARAVFFARDTKRTIEAMLLDGVPLPDPPRSAMTWGKAVDEVARSHGWTYDYISTLTVSQLVNARAGGAEDDGDIPLAGLSAEQIQAVSREHYRAMNGQYPGEAAGG